MRRREFIEALGGAAAWPLAAHAQQSKVPVIGFLSSVAESEAAKPTAAFRQGLGEQGYVAGRNVEILYRFAGTRYDRLPALAADLVSRRVSVIVAIVGSAPALAAKSATATIPIVFANGGDPVENGLVTSPNRPGGNVTGFYYLVEALRAKRLELLHQMVPAATLIGYLVNPKRPAYEASVKETETAARILGVRLVIANASTASEIESAFVMLAAQRIGAILDMGDPLFYVQTDQLAALAARYAVPEMSAFRENVEAGGLMSYGPSVSDGWRLAGTYAGRILKGEKIADVPVQQSTRIEFVLNLKTAKALGLTIPTNLLLRADEVIE
jgi:putative tryptophan/tyrosine transport system substrate-binding protein